LLSQPNIILVETTCNPEPYNVRTKDVKDFATPTFLSYLCTLV
jgi:hypothetical protein